MKHTALSLIVAGAVACASVTVACSDDDTNNTNPDPSAEGGPEGGGEGGPKPECTFASYVIGLVNGSTNATAQPDTKLGAGCKDTTDPAAFKALFP